VLVVEGRDLCADQRPVEVFVQSVRQNGEHDRFPLTAALHFLCKAVGQHGTPVKITIDGSGANSAAIEDYNKVHDAEVETRQVKYLNNVVEQDHRAIKRQVRPVMGFKSFWSAAAPLAGIELMHMIRKGQMTATGRLRPAQQFYALAN